MPIHERIYRRLEVPPRTRRLMPFTAIGRYGSKYATKGWFTKLVLFGAFGPCLIFSFFIYLGAQREVEFFTTITTLTQGEIAVSSFDKVTEEQWYRMGAVGVWFLLSIQGWFALVLTPLVGSHQVANDLRSHAFEVYLARPITSLDYLLGKILVVFKPIFLVHCGPVVICLVITNLFLEGSAAAMWSLYPRAILVAAIISLVNSCVILGISSIGKSSRYATVIWFVLNLGTAAMQTILITRTGDARFDLVSYSANQLMLALNVLQVELFQTMEIPVLDTSRGPLPCVLVLIVLSAFGAVLVLRRVRSGRLP